MQGNMVYERLRNDIIASKYSDVHLVNQENDINQFNTFEKKSWKYFIDGGKVKKCTKDYNGCYEFDYAVDKKIILNFISYSESAGKNLLDFINSVVNADASIFVKVNGFVYKDARKELLKASEIVIHSTMVDDMLIKIIRRYFPNLENIHFIECLIKSECNFSDLEITLEFERCLIEDVRSFNDSFSNIHLSRSNINKITPTTIKSKKIEVEGFSKENNIDIKKLFLMCNFPFLLDFNIDMEYYIAEHKSFNDSFKYMPDSAPNLESLFIHGKISSIQFLTKFKHLIDCKILCSSDELGLYSTYITDKKEQEKIYNRNRAKYDIYKIFNPDMNDECIIGNLEIKRILDLCYFLSTIDYTEGEKEFYFRTKGNVIENILKDDVSYVVDRYYECFYDRLCFRRKAKDIDIELGLEPRYVVENNVVCLQRFLSKILLTKNSIYHLNGKPIIFMGTKRPIRTVEEALAKVKRVEKFNLDDSSYNDYIHYLQEYNSDQAITIGELTDLANIEFDYRTVCGEDFLEFGEYGKKIYHIFELYNRKRKAIYDLEKKQQKYIELFCDLIQTSYNQFNILEKKYLYLHMYDYNLKVPLTNIRKKEEDLNYDIYVENEDIIFESINNKTNGLYKKYVERIREIYLQYYLHENPYDIEIKAEYIKKLTFSK